DCQLLTARCSLFTLTAPERLSTTALSLSGERYGQFPRRRSCNCPDCGTGALRVGELERGEPNSEEEVEHSGGRGDSRRRRLFRRLGLGKVHAGRRNHASWRENRRRSAPDPRCCPEYGEGPQEIQEIRNLRQSIQGRAEELCGAVGETEC